MKVPFDTLNYTKGAIAVGMDRAQAEYQAEQMAQLINDELVTKSFLETILKDLENRLTIKLGTIMLAGITILGFILKH